MLRHLLILPMLFALAACVTQPQREPGSADDAASDPGPPADEQPVGERTPVEQAVVVAVPPDRCLQLLESLESAQPAIESLDGNLAEFTERMEAALARLDRPEPAPRAMDCPEPAQAQFADKEIIGGIEWIYMTPPGQHYRARVDSGAETSSLSAKDVVEFERDGDDWVRFTFQHDGAQDQPVDFELPIRRVVLVRQAGVEHIDRRVVVEIDIRLGDRLQRTEFTLTDRSRMTYPVLLGRAFLMDLYVIDVARSYTHPRYEAP